MLNGLRKQHPYFHDNCANLVCFEKEPDVIKMSRRPFNVFLMVSGTIQYLKEHTNIYFDMALHSSSIILYCIMACTFRTLFFVGDLL